VVIAAATMRDQAAATAVDLFTNDPDVALVLSEISLERFRAAFELDPKRVVNVGIMEQTMIGVAAGFAMEGFHPIVHTIAPFLVERPYEQLKLDFGYQGLGGTFISVGASYDYTGEGGTHHAPGDVAALLAIPGFEILVPGHPLEVDQLVRAVYANGHPTYLRAAVSQNGEPLEVRPGRMEVVRRGSSGTVIAYGPMLDRVLAASAELDVSVLYATGVLPLDPEALLSVVGDVPAVVSVEPWYEGTVAALVAETLRHVPSRIGSIGVARRFASNYGTPEQHDTLNGLDASGIADRLRSFFAGT
jgi:transketolase